MPRSATVFNIGYTAAEAARFPWVQRMSNGVRRDGSPRPFGSRASDAERATDLSTQDGMRSSGA
jgi:hypothetical protein